MVEMYNYRVVTQVERKKKAMTGLLKGIMIFFCVVFILEGIVLNRGFMLPGFLLAVLYFVYDIFRQKSYEYTLDNNELTIDVIYGKRYRKTAHVLNLKDLETVAPNWHEVVAKYRKNGGTEHLRKYDYTSYEDDIPYYTMIITEGKQKIKLLLDLNEEMLQIMKKQYPERVFFA